MQTRPAAASAPPFHALRIALFFGGYFTFGGVMLPFFPVWLDARGLSDSEIAICLALPLALRVVLTPLAGAFADRAPNRRFAIRIFVSVALVAFLCAWPWHTFAALLATTATALIFWHFSLPVVEAVALTAVRRFRLDYGRMRFAGSVSFIGANLAAGAVLTVMAPEAIFWMMAVGLVACAITGFTLPVTPPEVRALDDAERPDNRPAREVIGNAALLMLFAASGLTQASHAAVYGFGSLHWQGLGFSGGEIGALWAIGVVCEIVLFLWSGAAVRRCGDVGLLAIGCGAAILRWGLFPAVSGFWGFFFIQCLHGLSFGASYLGLQHAIARLVPDRMTASAQGVYAMISGIIMAGLTAISGPLYGAFGVFAFAAMALPAGLAAIILAVHWRLAPR